MPRLNGWPRKKPLTHSNGNNVIDFRNGRSISRKADLALVA